MIEVQHISKSFAQTPVLKDISFTANKGELVVLIGPSGCGKSTLLNLINRLIVQTSGDIIIDGRNTAEIPLVELRRKIGYVIQSTGLFPHWTVLKNVMTVPNLLGWDKKRGQQAAERILRNVDLAPEVYGQLYPSQLSGGQAQRVGVARAMAAQPNLLLMDEPFGALDPITRLSLQQLLTELQQSDPKTIIFVTHDMDEALQLADRIVIMNAGEVAQIDTPINILTNPANDFVRRFVGETDLGLKLLDHEAVSARMQTHPPQPITDNRLLSEQAYLFADMSLKQALSRFIWSKQTTLPVLNHDEQIVAQLTLRDILPTRQAD